MEHPWFYQSSGRIRRNLERIEFPVGGNLRPGDLLRTVYLDRDECAVRDMKSAEGRNLFEIALDDYEPGCKQELWSVRGPGAFVHRDWRDNISLPNMIILYNEELDRRSFILVSQDGKRSDEIDDGRQFAIFNKLLRSAQYIPMSVTDYQNWLNDYALWNRSA